jgi:hypothetical protein
VGPPVGCSSTLDDPILGVLGRGFEPRATLQQPDALSTGPCPTPKLFKFGPDLCHFAFLANVLRSRALKLRLPLNCSNYVANLTKVAVTELSRSVYACKSI